MKRSLVSAVGALAFVAAPLAAVADPPSTAVGITINPTFGVHESFNDTIHVPPVPAPFIEVDQRFSRFELTALALPPTFAIPYHDAIQGQTSLRITILDATLRVFEPSNHFALGVGETIYNQTTHYATADSYPNTGEQQYSRVVGAHFEVFARLPFRAGSLETSVRYAPTLLGTQVSTYESSAALTRYSPERGEQIDAEVRYIHRVGVHTDAILGLRYVNYTAAYDVPLRPLSDRNAGLLPSFGYRWRLGP